MYRLLFQGSRSERDPVIVREPLLVIGRDFNCQLRLHDQGVSDRHAAIERREDGYYLRDLDSGSGVRVNDAAITQQRLRSGDVIELGAVAIRFEVRHDIESTHRPTDWMQVAALTAIALIILGQFALLGWVFSQPHPEAEPPVRDKRAKLNHPQQLANDSAAPAEPIVAEPAVVPAPKPAAAPRVLNRMIRLNQVTSTVENDVVTLGIQLRAQVGARELESSATAVAVQFFIRSEDGNALPMRPPLWLNVSSLKNFSSKSFFARFPGSASQYAGYVVRSYYRGTLQDIAASPVELAQQAPNPMESTP